MSEAAGGNGPPGESASKGATVLRDSPLDGAEGRAPTPPTVVDQPPLAPAYGNPHQPGYARTPPGGFAPPPMHAAPPGTPAGPPVYVAPYAGTPPPPYAG